jgi:CheY-like chemotaxis protein
MHMGKVLFIGKWIDSTKVLYQYLKHYLIVQLCLDNVDVAKSMMQIEEPRIVLINLEGWEPPQAAVFLDLEQSHQNVPVVTVGTEAQQALYGSFYRDRQFSHLTMPVAKEQILQTIMERSGMQMEDKEMYQDLRKLILLVDDSPVLLQSMRRMLEDTYRVAMATSGAQAMEMIEKETPDLIMLDYEMPELNGKDTLAKIRSVAKTKETPVVFLTGYSDEEHIQSVLELEPAGYFRKPPRADKILAALEQLL